MNVNFHNAVNVYKVSICVGRICCKWAHLCEISDFHSSFVDASGFLGYDTVLPGRCSQHF